MESYSDSLAEPPALVGGDDRMSLRVWFVIHAIWLLALAAAFVYLVRGEGGTWRQWTDNPAAAFTATSPAVKVIGFTLYVTICCTFLPLPTGWIVAALATREANLTGGLASTVILVSLIGAFGSMMANLNDYHVFTALLRHHRIAAIRRTRSYHAAAKWFAKGPFSLVLLFSILPLPMDVVRVVAAIYRYDRLAFAAANFVGRFARYAVIAFVTYYWNLGWIAPAALLALAGVLGAGRLTLHLVKKLVGNSTPAAGQEEPQ